VRAAGVGLSLQKTALAGEIRSAVTALLVEPGFVRRAAEVGARMRAQRGAVVAADAILGVI